MGLLTGVFFHAIGATSASMCYTPERKKKNWSWQTYWLAQATVCWLILPLIVAWLTIPDLPAVIRHSPGSSMWLTFTLGAVYGIGGTAFGIAIRYVGFSLTYAFSIGISCVLGTLLPPILHGQLSDLLGKTGSMWIMGGIALGIVGIALCGISGRMKEKDLFTTQEDVGKFNMAKGMPLCWLAGILASFYGLSLDQGSSIASVAERYGAGAFRGNVIYIFSNTGAYLSTLIYCAYLHRRDGTFHEFFSLPEASGQSVLLKNYGLACVTGILWYGQFFFYGLGHVNLGAYQFSSWAIHMIMLVMFSAILGIFMKEWVSVRSGTRRTLGMALFVLLISILMITFGNYAGA